MSGLIDQAERDRFIEERGKNISVIAPAGVGKTTSIVRRIVRLATLPEAQALERLPRLIVVTYSVRAAQQMQQRARVALRDAKGDAKVSARVQRAFQQIFFGTIHSYCVKLLDRFGHYLGLPSPVGLLQDDTDLWNRFLLRGLQPARTTDENLRDLFHFYPPAKLYALGKELSPGIELPIESMPELKWDRLLDYNDTSLHSATRRSIANAQGAARIWKETWAIGDRFRPLPKCPESEKAAAFADIWRETFLPLHEWLRISALSFGRQIANAYEAFRLSEAVMTYDDQVRLALRLLDHASVRAELAGERLSVLLDEAQDTDPRQFEVLRRVAGLGGDSLQPEDQSFAIVGDFQQAIYAPRSDLRTYRNVHDEISAGPRGTSSVLKVTFRCDRAIIDFVNRVFPTVLNDVGGQSAFEPLSARADAGAGQVVRWNCPDEAEHAAGKQIKAEMRARHEAKFVARRIKELGHAGLGASDWSEVAILCPRKNWLLELRRELLALDLPVQLHSSNEQLGDRTAGAWMTALIWVAAHPEDTFEIAGVLREVFGVSDHDMALFTGGEGERLRLDHPAGEATGSPVARALQTLREACAKTDRIPLGDAVRRLLEKTRLRERLRLVAAVEPENVDQELDQFLALIAARCADGITLAELAEELRLGLRQVHPAEEEIENAIQLLTSHKAKGLEWEAVIVPFVFRAIESKSPPYPRVVIGELGAELVCRDKPDFETNARRAVTERDRQQLQRLLYVMATRAKRSLVLIDDEELFAGSIRRSGWSPADLLNFTGNENREVWKALPEEGTLAAGEMAEEEEMDFSVLDRPVISAADAQKAVAKAGQFQRRTTPHTLAVHSRAHAHNEAEPERKADAEDDAVGEVSAMSPGVLYGTWWHEFVQTVPWTEPVAAWQKKFAGAQLHSPVPARSTREWELFRRSELAGWLVQPGRLVQVEMPFLWLAKEKPCLEGVMDLAVFSAREAEWRVIDWKTNKVAPGGGQVLVDVYREQIRAYVHALKEMLSAEVRGSLYLTQTGEWLPVD